MRLDLAYQLCVETLAELQIVLKGRYLLAVIERILAELLERALLYLQVLDRRVVMHHNLVVLGQPQVKLRAVAVDAVGLGERGQRVLRGTRRIPEAAVGYYLCLGGSAHENECR